MEQQNNQRSERRSQEQSRNGRGGGNGNGAKGAARGAEKKTRSYKHVQLEHRRPQLSKAGQGQQKQGGQQNARRANFNSPKKDPNATLKIIPLGGLDAIGKNMTVFECKGDMILDDAGLMFPDDDHPGIDLILPDYTYVLENADKLRGIIITHGHEAVSYTHLDVYKRQVFLDVAVLDVLQEAAALADEHHEATLRVLVLLVHLQVLGEVADALREDGDLHFGAAGIALALAELLDELRGALLRDAELVGHGSTFPWARSRAASSSPPPGQGGCVRCAPLWVGMR